MCVLLPMAIVVSMVVTIMCVVAVILDGDDGCGGVDDGCDWW